jgi:type II secretory pathway component PulF
LKNLNEIKDILKNTSIKKIKLAINKKLFFSRDRYYLFSYLSQGLKNGGTTKELLQSISFEYRRNNKEYLSELIEDTLYNMEQNGLTDAEAMKESGLITYMELQAIETISKSEPYKAMQFINEKTKNNNNMKWAIGMLFFPPLLVITGYLIFQPELRQLTLTLLEPVNQISTKKIPIPEYFNSRTFFEITFLIAVSIMSGLYFIVEYLKKNNIKLLFKLFKIKEREFVVNNFEVFLSLLKSGLSPMKSIELLSENNSDIVSKKIFTDIKESIAEGEKSIYEVLSDYQLDSATISYIRSGEMNNYLIESVTMALDYNNERYEKLIKILSKILPLIGEILMTIILLKPLLDIITVTTVGSLDFQL